MPQKREHECCLLFSLGLRIGIPKTNAGLTVHQFIAVRTWHRRAAHGAPAGHSIWFVNCAEPHCENKQALVQLSYSDIFNLTLLHPGLNFPLFLDDHCFIGGTLLLNSRFGSKNATYFCCGKEQYLPN